MGISINSLEGTNFHHPYSKVSGCSYIPVMVPPQTPSCTDSPKGAPDLPQLLHRFALPAKEEEPTNMDFCKCCQLAWRARLFG